MDRGTSLGSDERIGAPPARARELLAGGFRSTAATSSILSSSAARRSHAVSLKAMVDQFQPSGRRYHSPSSQAEGEAQLPSGELAAGTVSPAHSLSHALASRGEGSAPWGGVTEQEAGDQEVLPPPPPPPRHHHHHSSMSASLGQPRGTPAPASAPLSDSLTRGSPAIPRLTMPPGAEEAAALYYQQKPAGASVYGQQSASLTGGRGVGGTRAEHSGGSASEPSAPTSPLHLHAPSASSSRGGLSSRSVPAEMYKVAATVVDIRSKFSRLDLAPLPQALQEALAPLDHSAEGACEGGMCGGWEVVTSGMRLLHPPSRLPLPPLPIPPLAPQASCTPPTLLRRLPSSSRRSASPRTGAGLPSAPCWRSSVSWASPSACSWPSS